VPPSFDDLVGAAFTAIVLALGMIEVLFRGTKEESKRTAA
jgi:hypothetical protein